MNRKERSLLVVMGVAAAALVVSLIANKPPRATTVTPATPPTLYVTTVPYTVPQLTCVNDGATFHTDPAEAAKIHARCN